MFELQPAINFVLSRTTREDRLDVIEVYEQRYPEKYGNGVLREAVRSAFENRKREAS